MLTGLGYSREKVSLKSIAIITSVGSTLHIMEGVHLAFWRSLVHFKIKLVQIHQMKYEKNTMLK